MDASNCQPCLLLEFARRAAPDATNVYLAKRHEEIQQLKLQEKYNEHYLRDDGVSIKKIPKLTRERAVTIARDINHAQNPAIRVRRF